MYRVVNLLGHVVHSTLTPTKQLAAYGYIGQQHTRDFVQRLCNGFWSFSARGKSAEVAQFLEFEVKNCAFFTFFSIGARDRNRTGTPVIHEAADFKSDVSTYFTTRASPYCHPYAPPIGRGRRKGKNRWRRGPESNRTNRICNPGHNRFATAP